MEFENKFSVKAPIDEVYRTLLDVERVAPCVPGAQVLEQTGDDAYKVGIKVKVGPVSMQYRGDVQIVDRDEAAHTATMSARAKETRGQGTANAKVKMSLAEEGGETRGTIASDVQLSGKAASMGRGVVKDVSTRLIDTFATNLEAMLAGGGPPAAATAQPSGATAEAGDGAGAAAAAQARTPASAPAEAKGSMPAAAQGATAGSAAEATPAEAGAGGASAKAPPAEPAAPGRAAAATPTGPDALPDISATSSGAAQSGSTKLAADAAAAAGGPPSGAGERVHESLGADAPASFAPSPAGEPASLDVLPLVGSVIAGRMSSPRVALPVVGAAFLTGLVIGRRRGR
jgi:carbon monoxide dehydrogenase subunit G